MATRDLANARDHFRFGKKDPPRLSGSLRLVSAVAVR
jgi:hypothetical protein